VNAQSTSAQIKGDIAFDRLTNAAKVAGFLSHDERRLRGDLRDEKIVSLLVPK